MLATNTGRGRIIVPWDGSPEAATALPVASILARQLGVRAEILQFGPEPAAPGLESAVASLGLDELDWTPKQVVGEATTGILEASRDPDVVLVVLTTHGYETHGSTLSKVTERVLVESRKPVLIVRPEAPTPLSEFKRLLLPIDGSPRTAAGLRPAAVLAKLLGASVDLLHVAAPQTREAERGMIRAPRYVDQQQYEWSAWGTETIDRLSNCCAGCPPEVPVHVYLDSGEVGVAIQRFLEEHDADAVVLVRRSRLQKGEALTLRAVLASATRPVLICSARPESDRGS